MPPAAPSILRSELSTSKPPSVAIVSTKRKSATAPTKRKRDDVNTSERNEKAPAMDMYAAFGVQVADSLRAMGPSGNLSAARVMLRIQEVLVKYHPDNTDNTAL